MLSKSRALVHRILAAVGLRADPDRAAERTAHLRDGGGPPEPGAVESSRLRGPAEGSW